ncbi:hypothetical protein [Methanoculleus sp.]|uniref:hypothetical protein n=1 Tax=Methanoculleus sp. TaxID=90427 RepID=UPI0025FA193D|nr:hypothetical protein [Methanoculleus sp.]MCK9319360.1 hypothetical protein [Methanoculleus sp.]
MKDRIEFAFVVRTDELSGKALKAIAPSIKAITNKVEPQLIRIAEAFTKYVERDFEEEPKDKK